MKDVRQLGCVSQDSEPPESVTISLKDTKSSDQFDEYDSQDLRCVNQTSEKTKVHRPIKIQVKLLRQRNPYAVKIEDRSQEETERQERCGRGDAWRLAKIINQLKE